MPAEAPPAAPQQQFFAEGIPVEIGKVQRELKKLWAESDQVATRASRLNLVVYNGSEHSIRANTELVAAIARQHALRAILIAAKPSVRTGDPVRAWVNAHCQISKTGAKQRCSEQIAFQMESGPGGLEVLPNLVFSHLDSDLPLYLWWQGEFPQPPPDERLLAWVDRLLFDSADWTDPRAQFAVLRQVCGVNPRLTTALGDLNWTRLVTWRSAIGQFFDLPGRHDLVDLQRVEITHAPGMRLTGLLLTAWLGMRLEWRLAEKNADTLRFDGAFGGGTQRVEVALREAAAAGPAVSELVMRTTAGTEFRVSRTVGSDFFNTRARLGQDDREQVQVLRAGSEKIADLVSEELTHNGNHRVYLCVLDYVEKLLAA